MRGKDSSKSKVKTQKVVVPKGTIDPSDTTIIEIPENLYGQPLVIAKKKESQYKVKSNTVVFSEEEKDEEDIPVRTKRNQRSKREREEALSCPNRSCSSVYPSDVPGPSSYIAPEVLNLEETEQNEKMLILSQLEDYQRARRKFLKDASTLATRSNVSTNYQPTSDYIPQMLGRSGYSCRQPVLDYPSGGTHGQTAKLDDLPPGIVDNIIPSFNSTMRDDRLEKPMRSVVMEPVSSKARNRYLVTSGTNTSDKSQIQPEKEDNSSCSKSKSISVQPDIVMEPSLPKKGTVEDTNLKINSNTSLGDKNLNMAFLDTQHSSALEDNKSGRSYIKTDSRKKSYDGALNIAYNDKPSEINYGKRTTPKNFEDDCAKCCGKSTRSQHRYIREEEDISKAFDQIDLEDLKQQLKDARKRLDKTLALAAESRSSSQMLCASFKNIDTKRNRKKLHDTVSCPGRNYVVPKTSNVSSKIDDEEPMEYLTYLTESKNTRMTNQPQSICQSEQILKKKAEELKNTLFRLSSESPSVSCVPLPSCSRCANKFAKSDDNVPTKFDQKPYMKLSDKDSHGMRGACQSRSTQKQLELKPSIKTCHRSDRSNSESRKNTISTQTVETSVFIIKGPKQMSPLDEDDSFTATIYHNTARSYLDE